MRQRLAEKLLVEIMEWKPEEVSKERPLLQALSNFKYNEYQQFSIGTLFIESLVKWLNSFTKIEERRIAYAFLMNRVIFFSNNQILHLVNSAFNQVIQPVLINKASIEIKIDKNYITQIISSQEYKKCLRRSLFIGLSDGAKIDHLRRNSGLNNEQVIPTYEVSKAKVEDMMDELKETGEDENFDTVFLVDDFTASGTSYFRKEDGSWKGKIYKTLKSFFNDKQPLNTLINNNKELEIHLIFYIATEEAINRIYLMFEEAKSSGEFGQLTFKIHTLQKIESVIKNEILDFEKEFIELSKKYIDSTIIDRHFKKAAYREFYLGYNECCLPIILGHNTPNNTLPLLWWMSDEHKFTGLFPRITRHN